MLDTVALQRQLTTQIIGRTLLSYAAVGSTNDLAKAQAQAGHPEGLVIVADEQLAGRGRLGRSWHAPAGQNVLLSLLLRPALPNEQAFALTMLAAVALCAAVEQLTHLPAALKWPNDLLLAAEGQPLRKAAGILCELDSANRQVRWAVIGIGVNANWSPAGIVDGRELSTTTTSLREVLGRPVDRTSLLLALLEQLDQHYLALRNSGVAVLFDTWRARLATLGSQVTVRLPTGELHGTAEAVDASGALLLRTADGVLHQILTGDVGS